MKGIQFWAGSCCRSMLSFYEGIGLAYKVPIRVCVIQERNDDRIALGWDIKEFCHLDIVCVGQDEKRGFLALNEKNDWHQIFGAYQANKFFQQLILRAAEMNLPVSVCSEAPLNMIKPGIKRLAKNVYLAQILASSVRRYTYICDFVINLSGANSLPLHKLGWKPSQIIPCGYFPPPLQDSNFIERTVCDSSEIDILCSGAMTWHRGQVTLIEALKLLKKWGVDFRAKITQSGPMIEALKQLVHQYNLNVDFVGFLSIPRLIEEMQRCTCYVATGREEPWGIRVNDAMHCGAPLVVSRGMGAQKLVEDYGCGLTFYSGDSIDLAWKLARLSSDRDLFRIISKRVKEASVQSMPHVAAARIVEYLKANFEKWS